MFDLYRVPCDLSSPEVRQELADNHPANEPRSYIANGALNHSFTCRESQRRVFVAERVDCGFAEIIGDVALWLTVREAAVQVKQRSLATDDN